jgi:short-subunit dehydrogenase
LLGKPGSGKYAAMKASERTVILGGSRGLGAELMKLAAETGAALGISRKSPEFSADFSVPSDQLRVLAKIQEFGPTRIIYAAGGGPYGIYSTKEWKDHEWAFQVTFLFAARVCHSFPSTQIILVGSSVAESQADPKAASYSAAKHALRGLYQSIRVESPESDIRLFSPGYMDTPLLPKDAFVRRLGVWSPEFMAKELWNWCRTAEVGGHKVYPHHPS